LSAPTRPAEFGAPHTSVKLAGVSVARSIALVNEALIILVPIEIPRALIPGATPVTMGATLAVPKALAVPKTLAPPLPPPPHPAAKTTGSNAIDHMRGLRMHSIFFILFSANLF
jgi:hypothetical protein